MLVQKRYLTSFLLNPKGKIHEGLDKRGYTVLEIFLGNKSYEMTQLDVIMWTIICMLC